MKKSVIKSIYHWFIMSLVMGMPLVLTAVSYIPNAYNDNTIIEYDSIVYDNVSDLVVGQDYYIILDGSNTSTLPESLWFSDIKELNFSSFEYTSEYINDSCALILNPNSCYFYDGFDSHLVYQNPVGYAVVTFSYIGSDTYNDILSCVYSKVVFSHQVVNNGAYQVWQYNQKLLDMPINQWYSSLLNLTVGVPNEYSPINNIVVFPLYAIWVVIFDLLFDCIVMIPKLCHSWLRKLDKDNE